MSLGVCTTTLYLLWQEPIKHHGWGVSTGNELLDGVCWDSCPVGMSSDPEELEQLVSSLALEPLKSHVIGLGRLGGHGTTDKVMCSVIVSSGWTGLW